MDIVVGEGPHMVGKRGTLYDGNFPRRVKRFLTFCWVFYRWVNSFPFKSFRDQAPFSKGACGGQGQSPSFSAK